MKYIQISFTVIFLALASQLSGQQVEEASKVKISYADSTVILTKDSRQKLHGNVRLVHDSIYMYCDTSVLKENQVEALGNIIIIQDDTINTFADSLFYDGDLKLAELFYNVVLENGGKKLFTDHLIYNLDTKKATFRDTAILETGKMRLSSIRGHYDVDNKKARFYEEVTIMSDDLSLKTDSLDYDTDIDRAYFIGPTYITQTDKRIYCESGYYDIEDDRAFFSDNAIVYEKDRTTKADNIFYNEKEKTITLKGDAEIIDSISVTRGDEIVVNDSTKIVTIIGNGYYKDQDQLITGPYIQYHEESKDIYMHGSSSISLENGTLSGDSISYVKHTDLGEARGQVVWQDTVENIRVESDVLYYRDSSQYIKAVVDEQRPMFVHMTDDDTLYLSADTLISSESGDTMKFIQAIRNVQIYKSDLQAVCDSLYYDDIDSTFYLYYNPVIWSDTTQILADTLNIIMKNDEASEIIARSKAFIATEENSKYYNQIRGRYIHSYLDSSQLKKMHIVGNAESIYFVKDDEEAYVGPNKSICSEMTFHFANEELSHIDFQTQPNNNLTPMDKTTDADLYLESFSWKSEQRPMDKNDLRSIKKAINVPQRPQDEFEEKVNEIIFEQSLDKSINNK